MPKPARPSDVVVGLLTENTTKLISQAVRLLRSIRWFGGGLAQSRVVVCTVGELDARAQDALRALGAELRVVSRFHPANPTANRHQLIASLLGEPEPMMFLLDCDTIVAQDPLPYLELENFQAKVAPAATVSDEVFERLFAHFGLAKPPRSCVTGQSLVPTIPYFNGGVLAIPLDIARRLAPAWRRYNQSLADAPELVMPCQRHMHQASLSLALAETGVPWRELPLAMNFQTNAATSPAPAYWMTTDPVIVHYHQLATEDGYLLPTPYAGVQARIDTFNRRLEAEGIERRPSRRDENGASQPIVVLGMHRSGTSLAAQTIHALGAWVGGPDALTPGDMFNPTGHWELRAAVELDDEILHAMSADVSNGAKVDVGVLAPETRREFVDRARTVVAPLLGHGPFVLKDPRMSLLLPIWREALGEPVCVIVWRHPLSVARSLETRDRLPTLRALALWECYKRILLRDSEGLPRILVSYEELVAEPERMVARLLEELTAHGVRGLRLPTSEELRLIVKDEFNRSGRKVTHDESILSTDQRALLEALRSGSALREPVPPCSPHTLAMMETLGRLDRTIAGLRRERSDRDDLFKAVFSSRSWRLGYLLTSLLRRVTGRAEIPAPERWEALRRASEE